jgi:ABC-type Fe3+-hydroxamate transport system substrate-binding protein
MFVRLCGRLVGTIAVASSFVAFGCEKPAPPTPALSRATASKNQPLRIVALSPAIATTLRDLGLGAEIVGRHAYDQATDPSIPVCGDQTGIDYETLLNAEPTHVLLEWGQRELPERLSELASAHDWTVKSYRLLTLDDVEACAADLYAALRTSRGETRPWGSTPLAIAMLEAWSRRDVDLARAGRVLLLASVDPPGALGPGSFHEQILTRIGGRPAITTGAAWQTLDVEDVLALRPEAIIVFRPRARGTPARASLSAEELRAALGRLGTLEIPAVRESRVALIDDPLGLTPSTAMVGVAHEVAARLEAWAKAAGAAAPPDEATDHAPMGQGAGAPK